MKIYKLLISAVIITAGYGEVSVFDAGDLNSNEPYGLSENEKIIYQSKKKVENLSRDYTGANSRINELADKIDGLQNVLEGASKGVYENKNTINKLLNEQEKLNNSNEELEKKLLEISKNVDVNAINIKKLQASILELNKGLRQIASVGLDGADKELAFLNISKPKLLQSAVQDYKLANYQEAKSKFEYLAKSNYKPAQCNFYLAQIAFESKDYENALYHYKQSNALYKKANVKSPFMATILLNSGLSLKYQAKDNEAEPFFNALKREFPNSSEAKQILK